MIELATPIDIKECILIALNTEELHGSLPSQLELKDKVAEVKL